MPLRIISKKEWRALEPEKTDDLQTPVSYVNLKYDARIPQCKQSNQCKQDLRSLQRYTICIQERPDIDYNFYIGGDGVVYEGRGWTKVPLCEDDYNGKAIDICYIGMFEKDENPPEIMVKTMRELVEFGVQNGYIKQDYTLIDR